MRRPTNFSWVQEPFLSASGYPFDRDDLRFLRENGIDMLMTLTEDAVPKGWIDDAGLMSVHIPIADMDAPSVEQMALAVETLRKASESGVGVNVHCFAGKGRTGTILAAWLIAQGMSAGEATHKVRQMRPGSIESYSQMEALAEFAESHRGGARKTKE